MKKRVIYLLSTLFSIASWGQVRSSEVEIIAGQGTTIEDDLTVHGNTTFNNSVLFGDKDILNIRGVQLKDWDDNTGGTDNKYRLLARDGAFQFFNGGVVVGNYNNGTWGDLADGNLIVESKVGVGTTSPSEKLHVSGGNLKVDGHLKITNNIYAYQKMYLYDENPIFRIENTDIYLSEGQTIGGFQFYQNDASAGGKGMAAEIKVISRDRKDNGSYFGNVARLGFFVNSSHSFVSESTYEALTVSQPGYVGVRNTNPSYPLHVSGTIVGSNVSASSDRRWKKDITTISSATEVLNQLNPVSYNWKREEFKEKNFDARKHYGVIAQEIEKVLPELVSTDSEGFKSVEYNSLIALLVKAIQEKDEEIESITTTNRELLERLQSNSSRIARLESLLISTQIEALNTEE